VFERHVHHDQIAPRDDAEQAEREQQRADHQIMFEADVHNFARETREKRERGFLFRVLSRFSRAAFISNLFC
jgi:hypothetical protein